MVVMGTRRPQRGLRLCRRCALHRRGNIPRLDQILGATKYDKLSDTIYHSTGADRLQLRLRSAPPPLPGAAHRQCEDSIGGRHSMATEKIAAWTRLLSRVIWFVIVLIGAATVGQWLVTDQSATAPPAQTAKSLPKPAINWAQVDADIVHVLKDAASAAEEAATHKLEVWTNALMQRVDDDFLDWYFGYWNQQSLGLKALWYWSVSKVLSDAPDAAERLTAEIQAQFAARVLRPEIAQLELERLTNEVLKIYVTKVREYLAPIPEKYQITPPDWERYLDNIAVIIARTEGNRETPLTLKAFTVTTGASAVVLGPALVPAIKQIGGKVSGKLAGKAAGSMAAKTGAKVGVKAGSKLLGPMIGMGIILWDVWDHHQTQKDGRPILRQAIADYFTAVQQKLLHEPESGVMSVLHTIEGNIISSLRKRPAQS
jgi:hypothetical protein